MVGDKVAHGTKIVGSGEFSVAGRIDWYNAKYGKISVKLFVNMHMIHTPQGKICAAMVRPRKANDLPCLRKMIRMMPTDSGHLQGDAAYGGTKNYNAIRGSVRRPVIDPKSNAVPNGLDARADMVRFRDKHPRTFCNILRIRNNVESVFSSMKSRFSEVV